MQVSDFDFELPDELIAQEPAPRGASRMLVLDRRSGRIAHATVQDLAAWLEPGDLMVVNETRVFAARLLGHRVPSGGAVECLLLGSPITTGAPPGGAPGRMFEALVHPGQKLKPGARVRFEKDGVALEGEILARHFHGRRTVRLWSQTEHDVDALIDRIGHVPLPPYIHRADGPEDRERYQTVFARVRGSVAAPTAGLHFTPGMLEALERRGVERAALTLHVGYGTFKPVRVARVEDHIVDPELYELADDAASRINRALDERRRIVAVGTTTTRALEDAARRGGGRVEAGSASATTFIYPGFQFRVIGALFTNFHLPRSSLLILVSAFAGRDRVLGAYREAVRAGYRFYSYGDAMLIV